MKTWINRDNYLRYGSVLFLGMAIGIAVNGLLQHKIHKNYKNNKAKFDQIFFSETNNNFPTREDSISFFKNHGIDTSYVGKGIPELEIGRVVYENKLEKDVK